MEDDGNTGFKVRDWGFMTDHTMLGLFIEHFVEMYLLVVKVRMYF